MKLWPFSFSRKSLAAPSDELWQLFGGVQTAAGVTVTTDAALKVPAVASAVLLLSEAVASLDVAVKTVG
ncbi:phage portal protein, partial [Thioclava sp. BHET1]